jgi:hypothetical protein
MIDLHKKSNETPEQWLARLERIEGALLPWYAQSALALSKGYARHLLRHARTPALGAGSRLVRRDGARV